MERTLKVKNKFLYLRNKNPLLCYRYDIKKHETIFERFMRYGWSEEEVNEFIQSYKLTIRLGFLPSHIWDFMQIIEARKSAQKDNKKRIKGDNVIVGKINKRYIIKGLSVSDEKQLSKALNRNPWINAYA